VLWEAGELDASETGWKDTVRVNPGEPVAIAATFDGFTGRHVYHCHLLEHADHEMTRPFVVVPGEALAVLDALAAVGATLTPPPGRWPCGASGAG
jgi:Multicopper oxidase